MSNRQSLALATLLLSATAAFAAERVSVIIELQSPPAVESYLGATAAGKSGGSTLRAAVTATSCSSAPIGIRIAMGRG